MSMMYVELLRLIHCNESREFLSHRSRANECYHLSTGVLYGELCRSCISDSTRIYSYNIS